MLPEDLTQDERDLTANLAENTDESEEKDDEQAQVEHAPPENSRRWKEIYGKMKQYERELISVRDEKEALKEMVEEMRNFNKKLAEAIENKHEREEERPENIIAELKRQKKEALESLDYDKAEEINERIIDLKIELTKKKSEKVERFEDDSAVKNNQKELMRFINNTEWYRKDPEMRMYANQLDNSLLQDPDWAVKPVAERLAEVKRRVERRFGWNKSSGSPVEDSTGYPKAATIDLSEDERKLAKAFGISPQEWAKQKAFTKGGAR